MSDINFGYILHDFVSKSSVKIEEIAKIKKISRPTAYTRYFNNEDISLLDIKEILDIIDVPISEYFRKVEQELGISREYENDNENKSLLSEPDSSEYGNPWVKELLETQKSLLDIQTKQFKASEESIEMQKQVLEAFRKAAANSKA